MLLWMLACTDVEPTVVPHGVEGAPLSASTGDTGTTGHTGPMGDTGHTGDTGPPPMVDEALAYRCIIEAEGAEPAVPNLSRVTLSEGRCNDGSPPTAYVRAATDPANEHQWLVFFEGGFRCGDGESCTVRWCGEDFHNATKMSSSWSTETKRKDGLISSDALNAFSGWNVVYMPYCSSDQWAGTRSDVVLTNADGVSFRVHFEGAQIVDGLFDALELGMTSDDGLDALPSLTDADRVVLAAQSAGAMGLMHNLDGIADRLAPIEVVALLDGASMPTDPYLTSAQVDQLDASNTSWWETEHQAWGSRLDASCLADNALEPWRCVEARVLEHESLATPFFLHHDLRDRVLIDVYDYLAGIDAATFAVGSKRALEDLGATRPATGVHASTCAQHVSFLNDDLMHGQLLPVDGLDLSLHDAIVRWLDGHAVVAVDDPVSPASICP